MRALIICTSVSWGGLEQTALRDAVELQKRGVDVSMLGLNRGVLFEKAKEAEVDYHSINSISKHLNFELILKLKKLIKVSQVMYGQIWKKK